MAQFSGVGGEDQLAKGLVAFLCGLGGDETAWGDVPKHIRESPLGQDFDVAMLPYSAKVWSQSDIQKSSSVVQTRLETTYPASDPIYLIGYSLGGLIARDLCRRLLLEGPDELLKRIAAVITVGTPLEGARLITVLVEHVPVLARVMEQALPFIPGLSPKLGQIINASWVFDQYRTAIQAAKLRRVSRPKQFHMQIEDDKWITPHVKSHWTEDDKDAGTISGTHTKFVRDDPEAAAFAADVLLQRIRKIENSFGRQYVREFVTPKPAEMPDQLVLVACSHAKRDGGVPFGGPNPLDWVPDAALRQRVISKRSNVFGLVHDALLEDGCERGGNRAHQPGNRHLVHGPDLGGTLVRGAGGEYLAASERYNGRVYRYVEKECWEKYPAIRQQWMVLIMSGLYGLIEPTESIQNYDVHLTDSEIDTGQTIASMWTDLYTPMLQAYVRSAFKERKVKIVNLLGDKHYVDAINWHALPLECSVYHLSSPTLEDVGLLPSAGVILNRILSDPNTMDPIVRDTREYSISDFGPPPAGEAKTKVIFESRIGISKSGEGK